MDSARSKLARFGMAAGSCMLLGINAFTINCGFAPTGIGDETMGVQYSELAPQASALSTILQNRSIVLDAGSSPVCLALDYNTSTTGKSVEGFKVHCTLFEATAEGASETVSDAQCRFTVSEKTPREVLLECAQSGTKPCLGSSLELGRLTTTVDFVALAESNTAIDGYEVVDTTNAAVKATLRDLPSYCSSVFSAP